MTAAAPRKRNAGGGKAKGRAKRKTRKKGEFEDMNQGDIAKVRASRYAQMVKRQSAGKKMTAAEIAFMKEFEGEISAAAAAAKKSREDAEGAGANFGADAEDDFEEWTVRDGVVKGHVLTLGQLTKRHTMERGAAESLLVKVQRGLLVRYGFEGPKRKGALTGAERQALQWVISIEQLRKASQEWELTNEAIRRQQVDGARVDLEMLGTMVATVKQLADRRDTLVLKVRELGAKERRAGTGRGQRAMGFEIVINSEVKTRGKVHDGKAKGRSKRE